MLRFNVIGPLALQLLFAAFVHAQSPADIRRLLG